MHSDIDFMVRRELISNKIETFDDRAENYNYRMWKGLFENMTMGVIRDLKLGRRRRQ